MKIKKATVRCSGQDCRNTLSWPSGGSAIPSSATLRQAGWIWRGSPAGRIYFCHTCAPAVRTAAARVAEPRHYTLDQIRSWATGSSELTTCRLPLIKGDSMERADSDKGLIWGPCTVITRFWTDGGIDQVVN